MTEHKSRAAGAAAAAAGAENATGETTHPGKHRVAVVGGGAWGVALSTAAAKAGSDVLLYTRRLDHVAVPHVVCTSSLAEVAAHAPLIVIAVPSATVRDLVRTLGDDLDGHHMLVHAVRGLVAVPSDPADDHGETLSTISAIVREETPVRRVGAIGGPVLADELAAGAPSVMVAGSRYGEVIHGIRRAFAGSAVSVYSTDDLIGLEWASALTGILAVAVGFGRGLGLGAGLLAAFVTKGVHEAAHVAHVAGAEERTFLGLGGFGDLLAATAQDARPEVRFGEALAKGASFSDASRAVGQRIEAVDLAKRVAEFATRHHVEAPIFKAVARGLFGERPSKASLHELILGLPT